MDCRYLSIPQWERLLSLLEMTEEQAQARYDLVIHLETAAIGAEKFYTVENNAARKEGIEARPPGGRFLRPASAAHAAPAASVAALAMAGATCSRRRSQRAYS